MKPVRILIFFLTVFSVLFLLALVFPAEGIKLGEKASLQFADPYSLFKKDTVVEDIITAGLVDPEELSDDPEVGGIDSVLVIIDTIPDINSDSIIKARIDSISNSIRHIEFPAGQSSMLHTFFMQADNASNANRPLRIMHYGDSQLEVDRMTSLLRYRLQTVFGGSGFGLVPAVPLYFGHPTFIQSIEGDWQRYTGFGKRDTTLNHRNYGAMNSYTEFPGDSTGEGASLTYEFRKGRRASRFSCLKIYLHAFADSGFVAITVNDSISDTISTIYEGFQVLRYTSELSPEKLCVSFHLSKGGRIYGMAFDSSNGLQTDNIAMRGSSGLEFRRQDSSYLTYMLGDLEPGLFLLQFGGNTIPYIKATGYYQRSFKKELLYLKKLCPEAAIIVIGPSDMSRKEKGKFITWESVEPVRDALRAAALESGCAFWDMYEAMGGYNSMEAFVKADPPLAQTDYVHFTPKGANLVAGMFCSALLVEYNKYKSAAPQSPSPPVSKSPNPPVPQFPGQEAPDSSITPSPLPEK